MGRYKRFREYRLWGRYHTKFFREANKWKSAQILPGSATVAPEKMLKEFGIKVHTPYSSIHVKRRREIGTLLEGVDARSVREAEQLFTSDRVANVPMDERRLPPRPCYVYDGSAPLAEGMRQALTFAKGVARRGLPPSLLERIDRGDAKIDNLPDTLNRLIMQSQHWDSALDILPKRRDPVLWWRGWQRYYGIPQQRKNEILLDNLLRLSLTLSAKFPSLRQLRMFKDSELNAVTERNDELVRINLAVHETVCVPKPLSAVEGANGVESTKAEPLDDIYPVKSIIDLKRVDADDGRELDTVYPLKWSPGSFVPHTSLLSKVNNLNYPWTASEMAGYAVMQAFGTALAVAKQKYGNIKSTLPEPVVAQCVRLNEGALDFVVFQLNTLDLNSDDGVKNIAWIDYDNKFFSTPPFWESFKRVEDFHPEVFHKFLALILNGAT